MSVLVKLDRERHLRLNSNALADVEQIFNDTPMGTLLAPSRLGIQVIRALLWAGLRHEEPKLTVLQAGELIDGYLQAGNKLDALAKKVQEALREAGFRGDEDATPTKPDSSKDAGATPAGPFGSERG